MTAYPRRFKLPMGGNLDSVFFEGFLDTRSESFDIASSCCVFLGGRESARGKVRLTGYK
jgi:hypothetical protein